MTDDDDRFVSIRQPIEKVLMESLQDNNLTDVCRAWLQAGQSLAVQGGSGHLLLDMADRVETVAKAWRREASMMGEGDT